MISCHHCLEGKAIRQFERTQVLYNKHKPHGGRNVNVAFEVIHSFKPEESQVLSAESVNSMGVELTKRYFPNHEFVVVTHTDTSKTHNHILVNPVNEKTGKRDIINKKEHLYNLRSISDEIVREHGLSIIRETDKTRSKRLPQKVREIQRRGGKSYRLDLFQKADFARSYATSFDEYVSILNELSVKVAITEKTITYHYEGHEKGIRGKQLGNHYDKPGLVEKFKSNDELFLKQPQVKRKIRDGINHFKDGKGDFLGPSDPLSMMGGNAQKHQVKDYESYTKSHRRENRTPLPSDHALRDSTVPIGEIRRASNCDILDYCKRHNIACTENKKGQTTLKGREHVVIHGNRWTNTKNKTTGSLIELVSLHEDMNFLAAISKITDNKNLLLLEQHFGEVKTTYKPFYIPKIKEESPQIAMNRVTQFFRHHKIKESLADDLFQQKRVKVDKKGGIWFYSDDENNKAIQYTWDLNKGYTSKYHGPPDIPFIDSYSRGNRVTVYTDFLSFLKAHERKGFRGKQEPSLVLKGLDEKSFHIFLATRPHIRHIDFVESENKERQVEKNDFLHLQKKHLQPLDISVSTVCIQKAITRNHGLSL